MIESPDAFWSTTPPELLRQLETTPEGLESTEAQERLRQHGPNLFRPKKRSDTLTLLLAQFKSPIILILIFAAGLSFLVRDPTDALIIITIVVVSGLLGFWQERGATNAVERLLAMVQIKVALLRDGVQKEIPLKDIVPGDIVLLSAGNAVPGDCLILESKNLFVNEAVLTGETYPVEKTTGILKQDTPLSQRMNTLFIGTHVVSGTAKAVVVSTGTETELGRISERLKAKSPETEFERGVRQFGYLLLEVVLMLVIAIFAINVYFARPVLDSFLFTLALAVGLTPQLLPAIVTINLAQGAKDMARQKVIVKRLVAIENFGSMNVLCSDKTGTLTEGVIQLHSAVDTNGNESEKVLRYAYLNAFHQRGYANPIDDAIRSYVQFDVSSYRKLDEIPYDFIRKRLTVLVSKNDTHLMVTKGALPNILTVCSSAEMASNNLVDIRTVKKKTEKLFEEFSRKGFRTLGIAYRDIGSISIITKEHEADMTFLGFLVLFDPIKPGIIEAINQLKELGLSLKIVTGDNRLVAESVSQHIGLVDSKILTGSYLRQVSDEALIRLVNQVNVFAEVEPNQKERIILALRKTGNVVGYLGDGINDASALHAADVGISVDSAVDVAKEAAQIVLLQKDLAVLAQGIREGRKTFANTLKYVFITTSANFGNMFSMAGASLFLPFLPLLPKQILLINLLTDFPAMAIATDTVDSELIQKPRRWNITFIRKFMITFGIVSSVFDYFIFAMLLIIFRVSMAQFRTGWFLASVVTELFILLVIRTQKPFFKSKPSRYLLMAVLMVAGITLILPYSPMSGLLGFVPIPPVLILVIGISTALYIASTEIAKRIFYKRTQL